MITHTLTLSDHCRKGLLHKIFAWKGKAQSFSFKNVERVADERSVFIPCIRAEIVYYSGKTQGDYFLEGWDYKKHCMGKQRFNLKKYKR